MCATERRCGGCDSRATVAALEEAAAGAQRAASRSAELQPLLARAQERLPAVRAEAAATEKDARFRELEELLRGTNDAWCAWTPRRACACCRASTSACVRCAAAEPLEEVRLDP